MLTFFLIGNQRLSGQAGTLGQGDVWPYLRRDCRQMGLPPGASSIHCLHHTTGVPLLKAGGVGPISMETKARWSPKKLFWTLGGGRRANHGQLALEGHRDEESPCQVEEGKTTLWHIRTLQWAFNRWLRGGNVLPSRRVWKEAGQMRGDIPSLMQGSPYLEDTHRERRHPPPVKGSKNQPQGGVWRRHRASKNCKLINGLLHQNPRCGPWIPDMLLSRDGQ